MEKGSVSLVKISPTLPVKEYIATVISPKLTHLCVITSEEYAHLFTILNKSGSEPSLKLTWTSTCKVKSCRFSQDDKKLLIISETRTLQIYSIQNTLELVAEEDSLLLSAFLENTGVEVTEISDVRAVTFNKSFLTLLIDKKWLLNLFMQYPAPLSVKSVIGIPSCLTVASSKELIYCLTSGGNLSAYSIENGRQAGIVNLYSLLPYGSELQEVFPTVTVSANGALIAVSDESGKVYISSIEDYFSITNVQDESSRWDCGDSILTASSGTSYTSTRTVSSLLKIQPTSSVGDSASIYMLELTEREKSQSYKSPWDSYLDSIEQRKQTQNVTGKTSKSRVGRRESTTSQLICISEPPDGLTVEGLSMTAAGLAVWYTHQKSVLGGIYRLFEMPTGTCIAEQAVPDDTTVIANGCLGLIDAFLSPSCLWLFLGNLSRDVLVNKLLHCVETEAISQLLQRGEWGDLVIPLPTLAEGLRQHQMDVARLALGLHSQAFKTSFVRYPAETDAEWETRIDSISLNIDELFEIVYNALLENKHKLAFTEQLILLYLDHANDLLQFLHESINTEDATQSPILSNLIMKKKRTIIKQIMYHVVELRRQLRKQAKENFGSVTMYQPLGCLDDDLKKEWTKWQAMDDQDVIHQAVTENNFPLLQTFLITCRGWSSTNVLQGIKQEVFTWLEELLVKQEIETSMQILTNIGCEPYHELREICLKTFRKVLRDNLAAYLAERNLLNLDELDAWGLLKLIEEILHSRAIPEIKFSVRRFPSQIRDQPKCDIPKISKDCEELSIHTVTKLSREWRKNVIVELYFNTLEPKLESLIDPEAVWYYLLHNNKEDLIITWINLYYSKFQGSGDLTTLEWYNLKQEIESVDTLTEKTHKLFSRWDITQAMIDSINDVESMTITKEIILDHLNRFGVFTGQDKMNPCSLLKRFCQIKSLHSIKQILDQPSANMTFSDFEDAFLKFCIKNKLFNLVFPCFKNYEISSDRIESFSANSEFKEEDISCFKLWLAMKDLNCSLSDDTRVFHAANEAVQYLSKGNVGIYLQDHPIVMLAIVMYGNKMLNDIFEQEDGTDFPINSSILQEGLKQLPLLQTTLSTMKSPSRMQDVTVYQLLQGSSPFDISKLFGWQKLHIIKGEEMPHFASERLSLKFGHNATLGYLYYLKQGRPSFATFVFIVDQLRQHKKVTGKMKKRACNFAHGLALQNFSNQSIVCACVSFVKMLNSDPKGVRINVAAANKIYSYLNSAVLDSSSSEKLNLEQVGNLLHGLITTKEQTAEQILVLLETALDHSYSSLILSDDTITNQLLHWDLAVKFAKFHKIKLPEQFLKHCARQNLWLPFVLFIQLHQYPVEQVMILVKKFESGNLQEHLSHALSLKMYVKQPPSEIKIRSKLKARDSRKMLYSRIGVHKEEGDSESPAGSPNHTPNTATVSSSSSEDSFQSRLSAPSDVDALPEAHRDLFFALLNCHRSQDPPRALLVACQYLQNPVMAVFATCYEPSSALACFCTWVVTSLANHIPLRLKSELSTALQHHTWTPRQVQFLLEEIVAVGYVETLSRGFTIFFPENPLCTFTGFLVDCAIKKNFKESVLKMKAFKAICLNLKNNPSVMECDDSEGTFLNNGHWIATVAVRTTCIALANCFPSSYHQQLFLNTLCETSFTDHLPVNAPDFSLLANVAECLSGSGVHADWATLCHSKTSSDYQAELQQCLHRLIEVGKYQQALEFSKLVGLPKDSIVVAQWSNELKLDLTTSSQTESDIFDNWRKCHEAFIEANVSAQTAATFFREYSNKTLQQKERYHVLKYALRWLREVKYQEAVEENRSDPEDEDDVELEMWKCLLSSDIELSKLSFDELAISDTKLLCNTKAELQHASRASTFHNKTELTDDVEIDRLDALIGNLLDQGDVSLACRLEAMFNHKNQDLQLLLVCMSLAEGEITPYQLSAEHRLMLSEKKGIPGNGYKRRTLHSIRRSTTSISGNYEYESSFSVTTPGSSQSELNQSIISMEIADTSIREKQETLAVLEKLVKNLQHGEKLGSRLVYCFCIAMNLIKPFQDILKLKDPLELLRTALSEECSNKLQLASDIIGASQISSEDLATLLCDEIISAIRNYFQGETGAYSAIMIWGCEMDSNFHCILRLCDDEPSKLGKKLLTEAIKLGATLPEANKEVVEILIRAHDCYTAALNMDGIASVLHKARTLTANLLQKQEWPLMVRLVIGIGRYNEMNYIFQILKENDQFEFLLGKWLGDVKDLKSALLDFLKRHCPEDRETFKLVCLHYSLFTELAELWENNGHEKISTLLNSVEPQTTSHTHMLLINKEDTKYVLNTAMQDFTHAAKYYLEAEKLTKAMSATSQAELVALQLSILNTVPAGQGVDSLLKLEREEVVNAIKHKLSFPQACILSRAYNHNVDWGESLYQHCIVQGDVNYLPDFVYNKPLTSALVEDVATRFQLEPKRTPENYKQMKKFVLGVQDVEVKYCVASRLGFRDIVENLIHSPDVPYLKDTLWA